MQLLSNLASISGAACVIIAYFLVSSNKLSAQSTRYQWLNLIGAVLIMLSLYHYWNIGTFIIEVVWIVIAVMALVKLKKP